MTPTSRRNVLLLGAAAGAYALVAKSPLARAGSDRPHFLISIQLTGGADATYLFDGRGPKLTEKNLHQNYLLRNDRTPASTKPELFTPDQIAERTIRCERTNSTALRHPLMDRLWAAHRDCMSIVNGVLMLHTSVGHGENTAYLWGNAPRGGVPIYPPIVGRQMAGSPLDAVLLRESSQIFPGPSNLAGSAELRSRDVSALSQIVTAGPQIDDASPSWQYLLGRADLAASGSGRFAAGAKNLGYALRRAKATGAAFAAAGSGGAATGPVTIDSTVRQALSFFGANMTRVASIFYSGGGFDLHDTTSSQNNTISLFTSIAAQITAAIDLLKTTSYVDAHGVATPYIELTTFVISTEFGRTNRPAFGSVGATGSEHNPLTNFALVGGRGIQGGLVVGESDLRDCDDAGKFVDVSGAHQQKNARLDAPMGKPFDFQTQRVRSDLPARFDESEYICMPSVTNTIFDAFDIPEGSRFRLGQRVAPTLSVLRRPS